jgi:hypothetical protein
VEERVEVPADLTLTRSVAVAECPEGTVLLSGGVEIFGDAKLVASKPRVSVIDQAWVGIAEVGLFEAQIRAYAVCG